MKIAITKTLKVTDIPQALYDDLVDRLQFVNPKWLENQRMGRWNRGTPKILKFFRRNGAENLIIPRGYMRQLLLLSRKYGIDATIDDNRRKLGDVPQIFKGSLKPFQQTAVNAMLARDFGTLSAPTGSGKTVMALYIIAHRQQPALVIVHTKELAYQWIDRIQSFLSLPAGDIGLIGDGKFTLGPGITVALVQSLYKRVREVSLHIGHLVVDECHRAPSRIFTEAVKGFDAHYMLGLSATPYRRDGLSKLIFWHLGDVHHEVQLDGLVAGGDILDVEVVFRPTRFNPYYDPVSEYSKMLTELVADDQRNRLIAADIADEVLNRQRPGVCLVLSDRKQHCLTLQILLKHKYHVVADVLTGDLSMEQRNRVIERINHNQIRVIIATGQLIGEGFDCAQLSTLFLSTPIRFSGRLLQYLGRILRPSRGIDRAKVYDYVDELVGPLKAAAKAREKAYRLGR